MDCAHFIWHLGVLKLILVASSFIFQSSCNPEPEEGAACSRGDCRCHFGDDQTHVGISPNDASASKQIAVERGQ